MSKNTKPINPVLVNQDKFLANCSSVKASNGSLKIDFDSLLRKFGDGPLKKGDTRYQLALSKTQLEDEYILDLANTAVEHNNYLVDLVNEYNSLTVRMGEISSAMDRLVGDKDKTIEGLNSHNGNLGRNFKALVYTTIRHADLQRRKVVFSKQSNNWHVVDSVVDKVTPKRIYVRAVGGESTSQYAWDGTASFSAIINIEETFPEGVKEYYRNQQKAIKK